MGTGESSGTVGVLQAIDVRRTVLRSSGELFRRYNIYGPTESWFFRTQYKMCSPMPNRMSSASGHTTLQSRGKRKSNHPQRWNFGRFCKAAFTKYSVGFCKRKMNLRNRSFRPIQPLSWTFQPRKRISSSYWYCSHTQKNQPQLPPAGGQVLPAATQVLPLLDTPMTTARRTRRPWTRTSSVA